jgi:acetyl-CoA C-acetyltransferase
MEINDKAPVIVAAAQVVDRLDENWRRLSPADLAADAVRTTLDSTGVEDLASQVDQLMVMRTFVDSVPDRIKPLLAPFGCSDQFARSVANRCGMQEATAIYATAGGQSPQQYVATACSEIAQGRADVIVLCGAEAIATMRAHQRSGEALDWSESPEGSSEDHGMGLEDQFVPALAAHKIVAPIDIYPMMEHKKRVSRGMSRSDYLAYLGDVLTPLADAARVNPITMFDRVPESQEISALSGRNRVVGDPHLKSMVAKDGVNQSAAVVVMQYGKACELGLEQRAVFLRGFAEATEQNLLDRMDWSVSPALRWAYANALSTAGMDVDEIDAFDIYSCFPIAVIEAMEALGLELGEGRPISLTGGLPFFGGPGNNYSMHGIASAVSAIQNDQYANVLVGALGGHMSKHAVGVYSRTPGAADPRAHEMRFEGAGNRRALASEFSGSAVIETFMIKQLPEGHWLAVLAINEAGERVIAASLLEPGDLNDLCIDGDPIGAKVLIEPAAENTHRVVGLA